MTVAAAADRANTGARFSGVLSSSGYRGPAMADHELLMTLSATGDRLEPLPRDEVHRLGHWHEVFHCLVVAHRPSGLHAILQRRSRRKKAFPGLLDLSAAGHVLADETIADGIRELHEELGISPTFDELVELGTFRITDTDDAAEGINREIVHAFLLCDDRPLAAYSPDPSELDGVAEILLDDLLALFTEAAATAKVTELPIDGEPATFTVTAADLVPDIDEYWPTMLQSALQKMASA